MIDLMLDTPRSAEQPLAASSINNQESPINNESTIPDQ
jgi:hypothetical protein